MKIKQNLTVTFSPASQQTYHFRPLQDECELKQSLSKIALENGFLEVLHIFGAIYKRAF